MQDSAAAPTEQTRDDESGLIDELCDIVPRTLNDRVATYSVAVPASMVSLELIRSEIECGSLLAPYFGVLQADGRIVADEVQETRIVQTKPRRGYLSASAAEAVLGRGAILVLSQLEDWVPGLNRLAESLRAAARAQVSIEAHLGTGPCDYGLGQRRGAHALVVQVSGVSEWRFDDEASRTRIELGPGQLVHMPPSSSRVGGAMGPDCLYLVLWVQQPSSRDLAELALARFAQSGDMVDMAGRHHFLPPHEKADWLVSKLRAHLAAEDVSVIVRQAVQARQREHLSH